MSHKRFAGISARNCSLKDNLQSFGQIDDDNQIKILMWIMSNMQETIKVFKSINETFASVR